MKLGHLAVLMLAGMPWSAAFGATFTSNTLIDSNNVSFENQPITVQNCTLTVNGAHAFASLLLTNGAQLTHAPAPLGETNNRLDLTITGLMAIESGCRLEVSGLGYRGGVTNDSSGKGPGRGLQGNSFGGTGAGYGGEGSDAGAGEAGWNFHGMSYGSITNPAEWGSGGGKGGSGGLTGQGGAGGGWVRLVVGGELRVNGTIAINGTNGEAATNLGGGGGGSGGSLYAQAGTVSGHGSIQASGGDAGPGISGPGGGGAGGRIAIYYDTSTYTGTLQACGGSGFNRGGAGTIFLKRSADAAPRLIIDGGTTNLVCLTPVTNVLQAISLQVLGGANATFADLANLTDGLAITNSSAVFTVLTNVNGLIHVVGTNGFAGLNATNFTAGAALNVLSNAVLGATTPTANCRTVKVLGDLRIDATSRMDYTGGGYASGGPGGGTGGGLSGYGPVGTGGGHGGGGQPYFFYSGGGCYGSVTNPVTAGSSGGYTYSTRGTTPGGAGGGALRLEVGNSLFLDGSLMANGAPPGSSLTGIGNAGGGAGGSLNLQFGHLYGNGKLFANGGGWDGAPTACGGGGGRIALVGDRSSFTGLIHAYGGLTGGAGTIYYRTVAEPNGHLLIDAGNTNLCAVTGLSSPPLLADILMLGRASVAVSNSLNVLGDVLATNCSLMLPTATVIGGSLVVTNGGLTWAGPMNIGAHFYLSGSNSLTLNGTNLIGGNCQFANGVSITHTAAQTNGVVFIVGGDFLLDSFCKIDVSTKGYPGNQGPGKGSFYWAAGAGGYGGTGGSVNGAAGGPTYGSMTDPMHLGSGSAEAGVGGGMVRVYAGGEAHLDGQLLANGGNGGTGAYGADGGGSGGTINVWAGTLSGGGTLRANGGNGGGANGPGGGGGRIALHYATTSTFSGSAAAYGGNGSMRGGAGTVYFKSGQQSWAELVTDNGTATNSPLTLVTGATQIASLKIVGGANLLFADCTDVPGGLTLKNAVANFPLLTHVGGNCGITNGTITCSSPLAIDGGLTVQGTGTVAALNFSNTVAGDVLVLGGAVLTHNAGQTLGLSLGVTGSMTVDSLSAVDVTGKGFSGGHGPGHGSFFWAAGGGGYGGPGGSSPNGAAGGQPYGSLTEPVDAGSGGGGDGCGGGLLALVVKNELRVEGGLVANGGPGSNGSYDADGGGSGGTINVRATTFSGAGSLRANGGAGGGSAGPGGGGGRIALRYGAMSFQGTLLAAGGVGSQAGGTGTVYVASLQQPPGLAPIPDRTLHAGLCYQYLPQASAPDGSAPLSFSLLTKPAGMTNDPLSGLLTWQTSDTQVNTTNPVVLVVTAPGTPLLSATQSFSVIVAPKPRFTTVQFVTLQSLVTNLSAVPTVATQYITCPQVTWTALPGERYRLCDMLTLPPGSWHTNLFPTDSAPLQDWLQATNNLATGFGPATRQRIPAWGVDAKDPAASRFFRIQALP